MAVIYRRTRRRLILITLSVVLLLNISYILLPPDSPIRLAILFNTSRLLNSLHTNRDALFRKPASYPLNLRSDIGYLIKTGYGTRHRVPAQLDAFSRSGGILGDEGRSFMVVGDWTAANVTDAELLGVQVHDAIKMIMETKIDESLDDHPRFLKYRTLQGTVDSGDEDKAREIGKSFGWELDALKFIMGMELAYKRMPHKKWYIILDDDTFLIAPSLHFFLSRLDPTIPHYIGNAVGDYKARFAHGGSAVILSGETMRQLFDRPDIVAQSYIDSLDETWGDRLVAITLIKLGIYLDERYSHYFNGEPPELTRITGDRFCSPIISFHGLREPGAMEGVAHVLGKVDKPVHWGELWSLFGKTPIQSVGEEPVRQMRDHVGPTYERSRTWKKVKSADKCRSKCHGKSCLAWTYDEEKRECHVSPWVVIGGDRAEEKVSGINWKTVEPLQRKCR